MPAPVNLFEALLYRSRDTTLCDFKECASRERLPERAPEAKPISGYQANEFSMLVPVNVFEALPYHSGDTTLCDF